ncbi:hypothetical protein [Thermococcus sp. MV5]|uniref:hypothetical protein n=1 Tax=Thermococcus sp. MV5 TaxID=1638272 RepID=UPI001F106BB9|nr:hypothetical protein [Thermococcus sp. MV5]
MTGKVGDFEVIVDESLELGSTNKGPTSGVSPDSISWMFKHHRPLDSKREGYKS